MEEQEKKDKANEEMNERVRKENSRINSLMKKRRDRRSNRKDKEKIIKVQKSIKKLEINQFSNDGSFLEVFLKREEGQ